MAPIYSICESLYVTGIWHIRQLSDQGYKYGGGIDTKSLCSSVHRGWDIQVPLTEFHLTNNVCVRCRIKYQEIAANATEP